MTARLYRIILPVSGLDTTRAFYERVLALTGEQVSVGRYYIDCGGTILALFDAKVEDGRDVPPNPEHVYFAVSDLDDVFRRVKETGAQSDDAIATQPWGERSFYAKDPSGNPVCFVDEQTIFAGGRFIEE